MYTMQDGSNVESTLLKRISHPHSPTHLSFIKETVSATHSELTTNVQNQKILTIICTIVVPSTNVHKYKTHVTVI